MKFEYVIKKPLEEEVEVIHRFLIETDNLSIPPLSHRMNLLDFARKLQKNATLFEYTLEGKVIALNAVYVSEGYRLQMRESNSDMLNFYLNKKFAVISEEDYPEGIKGVILKIKF